MTEPIKRKDYPVWVSLSVMWLPTRSSVWAFVWISLALAAASVIFGVWNHYFFCGATFLVAALLYWLAIRWIDRYGSWDRD